MCGYPKGQSQDTPAEDQTKGGAMQDFGGAKLILFIGKKIVVVRRDDIPEIPWPGRLDLPGGGGEGGESAESCVLRETFEEVGLRLTVSELVWRDRLRQGVFFAAHLTPDAEHQIVFGTEGQCWSLMDPSDYVRHPDAIPHFADMVGRYMDHVSS